MRLTRSILLFTLTTLCVAGPAVSDFPQADSSAVPVEEYWPDGQLRLRKHVLRLEDGTSVDHGSFERWHDNGKREYEAFFVHGRKQGTTIRYHKNGRKASQQEYENGKRNGRCVNWNDAGERVKEESWSEGRPLGTWVVWQDGKVKWSHTFSRDKPETNGVHDEVGAGVDGDTRNEPGSGGPEERDGAG